MPTPTLYEISEDVVAYLDTIELCETDEERMECERELYRLLEAQVKKVDDFARFLVHLDSQVVVASQEIERLKVCRAHFIRRSDRLERYAVRIMQSLEVRKLEGHTSRLSLRTNSPAVEIDDDRLLPAAYLITKTESYPDKRLIKKALDSGESVPGAHLAEPTVSLIRG